MFVEPHSEHDIFRLRGEIKVNVIPEISPQLSKYIQSNPDKNLILDLSAVDFIDSSTIRMLINLHKRLEPHRKRLCLLSPSTPVRRIIEDVKLDTLFKIFQSNEDLEREEMEILRTAYGEFTLDDNGMKRLICVCPVCGSGDVQGYLIDEESYEWSWEKDSLFPASAVKDTNAPIDVAGLIPIVCPACYMSSLNFAHFHASRGDERPALVSQLSEHAKQHLSKSIKARKKIMESCVVIGDNFFAYPRQKISAFYSLKLADSCARSMAAAKMPTAPFMIGHINYLMIQYAGQDVKEELINNIRTWMSQVIANRESYRTIETAKAYFILFAAAYSLEKPKEAAKVLEDFSLFINSVHTGEAAPGINSPLFWHSQAQHIGEKLAGIA